jgi:hypothetical protein
LYMDRMRLRWEGWRGRVKGCEGVGGVVLAVNERE